MSGAPRERICLLHHEAELITAPDALARVSNHLLQMPAVAVDTEFFWERTFYPLLGLVQLATADGCWLIDTVALGDLRPLGPVLASPEVLKVLHDAPQDLGILARAADASPRAVFDTRLAAGFAGLPSTCSLQVLLRETLGIELAKAETRSDWLRRPLSPNQLRYAAEDVLYLLRARDVLLARCADDAVRGWLAEDLARLDAPALYRDRDPYLAFLRVKGSSRLGARPLAVLRELAAWRENEARTRDWPRAHVLPDALLTELAQRAPADAEACRAVSAFPRNMPDEVVTRILDAVRAGLVVPDDGCPQPTPDDPAQRRTIKAASDRLLTHLAAACAPHRIDPALVASRADADAYVRSFPRLPSDHPLASGWRAALAATFKL